MLQHVSHHRRALSLLTGSALVIAGVAVVVAPLIGVVQRGRADDNALSQWRSGGSGALVGSAPDARDHPGGCGSATPTDSYALVSFPTLSQYGYAGVAGDGGWDLLLQRSMVHYHGSAAPGQSGNDIVAFHREPQFEHIDRLAVGDLVAVQDRACHTWHYRITQRSVLAPDAITQLGPTQDAELTLITCTPWFQDYDRIVWRGVLIDSAQPASPTAVPTPGSTPLQPIVVPFRPTPSPSPTPAPRPTLTPAPGATPTPAPTPSPTP